MKKQTSSDQSSLQNFTRKLIPLKTLRRHSGKRVIARFVESIGWVYLGHVDQHKDEHDLVRGFTLSIEHHDNHYSVGEIADYKGALVQRTDTVHSPGKPSKDYKWTILQLRLNEHTGIHTFVSSVDHSDTFYSLFFTKYMRFRKLSHSLWSGHDPLFTQHFSVFGTHEKSHDIASLLDPQLTVVLAHHFKGIEFELQDNILYTYISNEKVSSEQLERLFKNSVWLAQQIESNSERRLS